MIAHPHITELHKLYLSESQPFRKVHRMIDLFESIIKAHTGVIISEYVSHNRLSDSAKGLLSQGLRTPSLGTWQLFSRILIEELEKEQFAFNPGSFVKEFHELDKALNKEKTNVIALRNGYAHGATPSDEQCEIDIKQFDPFLTTLLECKWLKESSISIKDDKVYLNTENKSLLLHPILLFRDENNIASIAFFNDIKNDKVGLLNYPLGKHYREKNFLSEFQAYLPIDDWKKSGTHEFQQRVEELTETFKGRIQERASLLRFVEEKNKGFFSVQGNPGIGKSALIAQFFKDLKSFEHLTHVTVIEYFIRRGTQQAQSEYLINYLIKKTDEVFPQGKMIRADGKMIFELQSQLYSKWRLWEEHCHGKKLLFLIDGIDEGVENELPTYLPRENFENILFIYGSRPGGHKSIDDLWNSLPLECHTKLELSSLGKEDIRAMIYEVGNKYELERNSPWIDAVQKRSQGNPLYLKLLCNAIENGDIELNDIQGLPSSINDYYKAIILRYANDPNGDDVLNSLFTFAAAKDYLTFDHLKLINQLGTASLVRIGAIIKEVLYENPLTEGVLDFQLFHESFREYLVKLHNSELRAATLRIISFCATWKEHEGTWEQRYALEFYASHLFEHKKDEHRGILLKLMYDEKYTTAQKQVLENFNATNTVFKNALLYAAEIKLYQEQLEAALCIIDLRYEEANDTSQILAMVANGHVELALKRIESFGGTDEVGLRRKFTIYMLCLVELNLQRSVEKAFEKEASEKILNHLDEQLPIDHSILNWEHFFPSNLIFKLACKLASLDLQYLIIYKRTSGGLDDFSSENDIHGNIQIKVLNAIARIISDEYKKSIALTSLAAELAKQGKAKESATVMQESQAIAYGISDITLKPRALLAIALELTKLGQLEESLLITRDIDHEYNTIIALTALATELAKQGKAKESASLMQESLAIARCYNDDTIWGSMAMTAIAAELAKQGKVEESVSLMQESLAIARDLNFEMNKCRALTAIAAELAQLGKVEESASVMQESLTNARGNSEQIYKNEGLTQIAVELTKLGKVEESLAIASEIGIERSKSDAFRQIATELAKQGQYSKSLALARGIRWDKYRIGALRQIAAELTKQKGHVQESASVMQESLTIARGKSSDDINENLIFNQIAIKIAKLGQLKESLAIARSISSGNLKSITLKRIATELAEQGHAQESASVIQESLTIARDISDKYLKSYALKLIAVDLAKQGQMQKSTSVMKESLAAALGIRSDYDMGDALEGITVELAKQGQVEESLAIARDRSPGIRKYRMLRDIAVELAKKGQVKESVSVMQESLAIARGLINERDKSYALTEIAIELAKQVQVEESASLMQESLAIARGISHDGALTQIAVVLAKQGQVTESASLMEEALAIARNLNNERNKSRALKNITIEMAKQGNFSLAENIGYEITQISTRQGCWVETAQAIIKVQGWEKSLQTVHQFHSEEAQRFYLKGWVGAIEFKNVTDDCINKALHVIVDDSTTIERLLQKYAISEIALGRPTFERTERLNRTLNMQWLLNITTQFTKPQNQDTRNSNNLDNWLHEITDEDDRDQIQLWAKQVAKVKISETDFLDKLETLNLP
jgi:tetratricopeptide (TPR) repeat protein